eukprot:gene5645-6829_t
MNILIAMCFTLFVAVVNSSSPIDYSGYKFPEYPDLPKYLNIGHDSGHVRIKERYALLQRAIREVEREEASSGFMIVEWGSEYGALCLSAAEDFPSATVFSVDADYQARPLPEHLTWYTVPAHAEHIGMIPYQLEVANQAAMTNFDACQLFVTDTTFMELQDAGLKLDVQFGIQFFHWLMQYVPDRKTFEKVLADYVSLAKVTLVDLPPKGTSVPDTGPWFEEGENITQVVVAALKKYDVQASVEELTDENFSQNPFHLFRITNSALEPQSPSESLELFKEKLNCVTSKDPPEGFCSDDGSVGVQCDGQATEALALFDGSKRLLPPGSPNGMDLVEEFEAEGQLFYYNTRTKQTQWHTPRSPHYIYRQRKFVYSPGSAEL